MSVVLVATLYPAPGSREEVIAALDAAVARVHAEDQGRAYVLAVHAGAHLHVPGC